MQPALTPQEGPSHPGPGRRSSPFARMGTSATAGRRRPHPAGISEVKAESGRWGARAKLAGSQESAMSASEGHSCWSCRFAWPQFSGRQIQRRPRQCPHAVPRGKVFTSEVTCLGQDTLNRHSSCSSAFHSLFMLAWPKRVEEAVRDVPKMTMPSRTRPLGFAQKPCRSRRKRWQRCSLGFLLGDEMAVQICTNSSITISSLQFLRGPKQQSE